MYGRKRGFSLGDVGCTCVGQGTPGRRGFAIYPENAGFFGGLYLEPVSGIVILEDPISPLLYPPRFGVLWIKNPPPPPLLRSSSGGGGEFPPRRERERIHTRQ